MALKHRLDSKNAYRRGTDAQLRFEKIMSKQYGYVVTESTPTQDKYGHWDYKIEKGDKEYLVDVKSLKHVSRRDSDVQEKWFLVEFKCQAGWQGWLYGEADFIAFELESGFLMVKRAPLLEMSEKLSGFTTAQLTIRRARKNKEPYELYKIYNRDHNEDVFMYVTKEDLLSLPHKLKKDMAF